MLTAEQVSAIEEQMAAEHKKDIEALHRLKRFLAAPMAKPDSVKAVEPSTPERRGTDKPASAQQQFIIETGLPFPVSIVAKVEKVLAADTSRTWTVPTMVSHLQQIGFPLLAKKPEATMGLVFNKLTKRGKVRVVQHGSGRSPNIYRAAEQEVPEQK